MIQKTPKELGLELLECIKSDLYAIQHRDDYVYTHVQKYAEAGANLNVVDNNGWSCLIHAIYHNNIHNIKELIKYGANINMRVKNGWTALMYSSNTYKANCLDILIDAGADLTISDFLDNNFIDRGNNLMYLYFNSYDFQKKVLSKYPILITSFKRNNITIYPDIIKEFSHLFVADDLGLI